MAVVAMAEVPPFRAPGVPFASSERFETLVEHANVVIEHIVSSAMPVDTEYVQPQAEWVMLLTGSATLEVAGEVSEVGVGDWVFFPPGTSHRVTRTEPATRWLA